MRISTALVSILALCAGAALAQTAFTDSMRGPVPLAEETKPPPLGNTENNDIRRERAYAMQPPTIPHKTEAYQVDLRYNACLQCHRRSKIVESQAIPVSVTHYMDRDGNFLAEVSPRRYFCLQCHVPQYDAKPLIGNTYEDVDKIVERMTKKGTPKKAGQ